MILNIKRIVFCGLAFLAGAVTAQTITNRNEFVVAGGSGDFAPFWHFSNTDGVNSYKPNSSYLRVAAEGEHPFEKSSFALDWGVDLVSGYNLDAPVFVQQAYVDASWKKLNLSVGQKERYCIMKNPRLSTGGLFESGNARPIPQVRLEIPEFWAVRGTGGWFSLRGHLAYGFFTDSGWKESFFAEGTQRTSGVLYHSKSGFMRFGNAEKFPLTVEFGLQMATQFGGKLYNKDNNVGENYTNPTRLKDFFLALIPLAGDDDYLVSDQVNVAGNVLGSWAGAITWNAKDWKLTGYYDHTFEDHSQMFWEYGLWTEQLVGLELELKRCSWLRNIVLEYFNSKEQSGPVYHDSTAEIPDQISCRDNNYGHYWYGGWYNYGRMIATPLCSSPIYNKNHLSNVFNTRVEAFHLGLQGSPLNWLGYRLLYTRSNNWGTYRYPFKDILVNRSGLVELTFTPGKLKNWSFAASFAFDTGTLYGDNYGGMLSVVYKNVFNLLKK